MNDDQTPDEFVCMNCAETVPAERVSFSDDDTMCMTDCPHCGKTQIETTFIAKVTQVVEGDKHIDDVLPGFSDVDDSTPDQLVFEDEEGNRQTVDLNLEDTSETLDEFSTGSAETCDMPGCPETENLEALDGFGAIEKACETHASDLRGLERYKMTEHGLRLRDDVERPEEEQKRIEKFQEALKKSGKYMGDEE